MYAPDNCIVDSKSVVDEIKSRTYKRINITTIRYVLKTTLYWNRCSVKGNTRTWTSTT